MPVNINDSFVAERALDYAKLCDLSYAKWNWSNGKWILDTSSEGKYGKLWEEMVGKQYKVLNFWDDTQGTGYVGQETGSGLELSGGE